MLKIEQLFIMPDLYIDASKQKAKLLSNYCIQLSLKQKLFTNKLKPYNQLRKAVALVKNIIILLYKYTKTDNIIINLFIKGQALSKVDIIIDIVILTKKLVIRSINQQNTIKLLLTLSIVTNEKKI